MTYDDGVMEFIRTICHKPADDFSRLVFADWLMDERVHNPGDEWDQWQYLIREPSGYQLLQAYKSQCGKFVGTKEWVEQMGFGQAAPYPYLVPAPEDVVKKRTRLLRKQLADILPKTYIFQIMRSEKTLTDHLAGCCSFHELRDVFVQVRHGFIESIALNQRLFNRVEFTRALFERHPVRDIYLTRQDPTLPLGAGSAQAAWLRNGRQVGTWPQSMIATTIWDLLTDFEPVVPIINDSGQQNRFYRTANAAYAALSAAAVKWGRQLAGLEPKQTESPRFQSGQGGYATRGGYVSIEGGSSL